MREEIWLKLRESQALRKLYALPVIAPIMKKASLLLLPSSFERVLEVKEGPGKGFRLEINPRWQPNLWQGEYEPSADRIMERYFRPGKTFYDVGGGLGFYSLVAVRKGANVITLEPDPQNFATIQRHARLNKLEEKFNLMPLAAYSHTGTILLQPSPVGEGRGHGNSVIQEVYGKDPTLSIEVNCTTLDDLARNSPRPDLIKIDVEGAEARVFRGAEWVMCEIRPPFLCEVHSIELGTEILKILDERNYQSEWLEDDRYTVRWLHAWHK